VDTRGGADLVLRLKGPRLRSAASSATPSQHYDVGKERICVYSDFLCSSGRDPRRRSRRTARTLRLASTPCAPQDALLLRCVAKHGPKNWSLIARSIPGRTGKSCRLRCAQAHVQTTCCWLNVVGAVLLPLRPQPRPRPTQRPQRSVTAAPAFRWLNQLNPNVKKEPFSGEEDAIIMAAHTLLGNKWASISKLLVGRCAAAAWPKPSHSRDTACRRARRQSRRVAWAAHGRARSSCVHGRHMDVGRRRTCGLMADGTGRWRASKRSPDPRSAGFEM
jgi:hypothetical protein